MTIFEREVRTAKRECTALDTVGDKAGFDEAAVRLKEKQQKLKDYCSSNGLTYKPDRTATPGYGKSEAAKVTASYKKSVELEKAQLKLKLDIDGGSDIINYARFSDVFSVKKLQKEKIDPQEVLDLLEKSDVGKEALKQLKEMNVKPNLDYSITFFSHRGEQQGRNINIYMNNIPNCKVAAQTIIHETTHLYYGIGQSQWAEAVCFAKEKMFLTGKPLTFAEKRYIVSLAKKAYPEFNWKKGGYINGQPRKYS